MKAEDKLKTNDALAGQVVLSTQGRDKGKYAVVVKIETDGYVYIADGVTRRISKPKLKKLKHLKLTPYVLQKISDKLSSGQIVLDAEIAKGLKVFDKKEGEIG